MARCTGWLVSRVLLITAIESDPGNYGLKQVCKSTLGAVGDEERFMHKVVLAEDLPWLWGLGVVRRPASSVVNKSLI